VIVLSEDKHNKNSEDIVVIAVTSQSHGRDYEIALCSEHMQTGHLPKASYARADKIYTLSQDIVRKHYGTVSESFHAQLIQSIDKLIALPERI